jgi:Family of unknown function (DUF6263)
MKRIPLSCLLPAFLLLLLAPAPASAQKGVVLRYKFGPKDKLIYRTTTDVKQTRKIGDNTNEVTIASTEIVERRLDKIDSQKNFVLETENKDLRVQMKIGGVGEYKFKARSEENERASRLGAELTPLYETLTGAVLNVTVSPRGQVVAVKGYKELLAPVLKGKEIAKQFAGAGTDKYYALQVAEFYPAFSKKPVKPGDTWTVPFEISIPKLGTAKGKKTYKYIGQEKLKARSVAKVTYTYDLTFKLDLEMGGAKVTGELAVGKSSGTVLFDVAKGQLVSLQAEYHVGGDLTVTAGGNDIAVRTDSVQKYKVEQLDKLPN